MSQDYKHSRKLREMFRVFQRQKRENRLDDECDDGVQQSNRKISCSQNSSSEIKPRKKKSTSLFTDQQALTTTVDEQEPSNAPVKSAAEIKRQNIRLKYGLREKDQEFYRKSKDEDNEEFENVNAVARPAATKMRKAKLKWKSQETKEDSAVQKSSCDPSEDLLDDTIESEAHENSRVAEIKRRAGVNRSDISDKNHESLTELRILIIRIEELELANRKLTLQMKRMKKLLLEKERKIEELTSLVSFLQKSGNEDQEEKPTNQQETIAIRGLEIMKRNQLLEQSVRNAERTMLSNFFEAVDPKPTQAIVMTIDKALTYAIEVLLMKPDQFDDFVDNELRIFLLDTKKAKRVLLDVMLLHPEYVPRTWGGDVMAKRQRERRQAEMERRQNPVDSKAGADLMKISEQLASISAAEDDIDFKTKDKSSTVKKIAVKAPVHPTDPKMVTNVYRKNVPDEKMSAKDIKSAKPLVRAPTETYTNQQKLGAVSPLPRTTSQSTTTKSSTDTTPAKSPMGSTHFPPVGPPQTFTYYRTTNK